MSSLASSSFISVLSLACDVLCGLKSGLRLEVVGTSALATTTSEDVALLQHPVHRSSFQLDADRWMEAIDTNTCKLETIPFLSFEPI